MSHSFHDTDPTAWLDVGHAELPYWRVGTGPDLVFVHGWPLHAGTYAAHVERLKDRFTCHLIDMPGAGRSRWQDPRAISMKSNIEALRGAIAQMDLGEYGLIAHDSGAVFTRYIAAEDPRVKALVMGNTEVPGHRPWLVQLLVATAGKPGSLALFRALLRWGPARRSALGFGGCFTDKAVIDGVFYEEFIAPLLGSRAALVGTAALVNDFDWGLVDGLDEVHRRIQAPAALIWGADDKWFPLAKARECVDQFGEGASLHELAPGKLFAHHEYPDLFLDAAEPLLERQLLTRAAAA